MLTGRSSEILGELLEPVAGENNGAGCRPSGVNDFLDVDLAVGEESPRLSCSRAMANSRSMSLTSRVVTRCSIVRLSWFCIVCTRLPTLGGTLSTSVCCSASLTSGVSQGSSGLDRLATVFLVGGLKESSLSETAPNAGEPKYVISVLRRVH